MIVSPLIPQCSFLLHRAMLLIAAHSEASICPMWPLAIVEAVHHPISLAVKFMSPTRSNDTDTKFCPASGCGDFRLRRKLRPRNRDLVRHSVFAV
jgi:hypothetical protein